MRESDRPAALGGPKAIPVHPPALNRWPIVSDEEIAAVTEVLRSGEWSQHGVTRALEEDFERRLGVKHALAYCNGTSALFAALHAFHLQPGDEVIVPSATYWASVLPVLWCGAVPIFCESENVQLGLDPDDVERRITSRTRAMVIVHLWGMPSRMDRLMSMARRNELKVLEDASHAHGATWRGMPVGTIGDAGVFSLQTTKLVPAGEGGILVTNDDAIHEHAICLGHYERLLKWPTDARRFAGTGFGWKHRMAPLSAAVARCQFRYLSERNRKRNDNIEFLSHRLELQGLRTHLPPEDVERVYFLFVISCDEEAIGMGIPRLVECLKAEGCDVVRPKYPLLHQQPVFTEDHFVRIARLEHFPRESLPRYRSDALPRTETESARLLQLPTFPAADREMLEQYAHAFEKVLAHAGELSSTGA